MKNFLIVLLAVFGLQSAAFSQDMTALINKVSAKLNLVNDYTAEGSLKTDVSFIKAPSGFLK